MGHTMTSCLNIPPRLPLHGDCTLTKVSHSEPALLYAACRTTSGICGQQPMRKATDTLARHPRTSSEEGGAKSLSQGSFWPPPRTLLAKPPFPTSPFPSLTLCWVPEREKTNKEDKNTRRKAMTQCQAAESGRDSSPYREINRCTIKELPEVLPGA